VQEECFKVDLVVMGFSGGANLDGVKGDHVVLAPAYNVTHEEVEEIVRRFERAVGRAVGVYFGESGV
jgi:adenosylmethionine-8-amino-7-oxononanoate aminotransferase